MKSLKVAATLVAFSVLAGCAMVSYSGKTAYRDITAHDPAFNTTMLATVTKYGYSGPEAGCIYREALQILIDEMGETYVKSYIEQWRNSTQFVAGSSLSLSFDPNGTPFDPVYYLEGAKGAKIAKTCNLKK